MKRQIIKTKPVQPYRTARLVIAAMVVIVIAAIAIALWTKTHATHASAAYAIFALQDLGFAASNAPNPVVL